MRAELEQRLVEHPALQGLTISEMLRQRAGSHSVYLVRYKGRPAFLKLFDGSSPEKQAQAAISASTFAASRLNHSGEGKHNATARILLALPDAGVVVFAPAPGQQLSLLLASAPTNRRDNLIARAGQWLEALTYPPEAAVFAPYFWLSCVKRMACNAGPEANRPMISHHLAALSDLAESLRGAVVLRARSHGDFTPDNLFLDGDIMTAIDMQQNNAMPVARDIARFLVWIHSRRTTMTLPTRNGISLNDYSNLMRNINVNSQEQIVRFMIGTLLAEVYLDSPGRVQRRQLLIQAMNAWQSCPFSASCHSPGA